MASTATNSTPASGQAVPNIRDIPRYFTGIGEFSKLVDLYLRDPDSNISEDSLEGKRQSLMYFFRFLWGSLPHGKAGSMLSSMLIVKAIRAFRTFLKDPHCQYNRINRSGCLNSFNCDKCKFFKPCADSSIRKKFNDMNKLCKFLLYKKILKTNPVKRYKETLSDFERDSIIYNKKKELTSNSSRDKVEMSEFLGARKNASDNPRLSWCPLAMDIAVDTGMRRKSICLFAMWKMRFNESLGWWEIHLTKSDRVDDVKKHGQIIPITQELHERIVTFVEARNERLKKAGKFIPAYADWVIVSETTGRPISLGWFSQCIHEQLAAVIPEEEMKNRELCLHSIRKLYGTTMHNEKGFSVEQVSMLLGHKDTRVTRVYLRLNDAELTKAYKEKSKITNLNLSAGDAAPVQVQVPPEGLAGKVASVRLELRNLIQSGDPSAAMRIDATFAEYERLVKQWLPRTRPEDDVESIVKREIEKHEKAKRQPEKSKRDRKVERALELHQQGKGCGAIAKILENEFGEVIKGGRKTVYYWVTHSLIK